jgi:predicted metalloprotease with PDZ domain
LIDQPLLFKRLENVPRRALIARHAQGLSMTVREAGKDKQPNRQLVYGGGSLAALALDVELRKRSADRVGLPDLLREMRRQFGQAGQTYDLDDIVRIAGQLTDSDFGPFLAQAVESTGDFDIRPAFQGSGCAWTASSRRCT